MVIFPNLLVLQFIYALKHYKILIICLKPKIKTNSDLEDGEDADQTGQIIWNYYKVICVQSKKGDIKSLSRKRLTLSLQTSLTRMQFNSMQCHLTLLICRASLSWLINVSNSINNIPVENTNHRIDDESVVHFSILLMKILEHQSSLL